MESNGCPPQACVIFSLLPLNQKAGCFLYTYNAVTTPITVINTQGGQEIYARDDTL
jgi:hypothetical protein